MSFLSRPVVLRCAAALALGCFASSANAEGLTTEDFKTATTKGIVALCTAPETDPLHQGAVGYCIGYLTGAYHYYKAIEGVGGQPKLVCASNGERSRREEVRRFVAWAKANPEHGEDLAIDSMFRYLSEQYPCP